MVELLLPGLTDPAGKTTCMIVEFVKSTRGKETDLLFALRAVEVEAAAQAEEGIPVATATLSFPHAHFSTASAPDRSPSS